MLGRNEEAIKPSERLIQLDPLSLSSHQNLGSALFSVGRFDEALAIYGKALEIDPSHFFSYHELGHILAELGRYDLAIPYYEKARDLGADYWMNCASREGTAHQWPESCRTAVYRSNSASLPG